MNLNLDFFRNRIGVKDAKQLAKALHRAIKSTPPSSPEASRGVIFSLPWPPVRADLAPPQPPVAPVLPDGLDPCHTDLVTWDTNHPCSFVTLGNLAPPHQEELFPQGKALHWTHRGALSGGLVFGLKQERQAVLEHMVLQAGLAGQSVLWMTEAQDAHHVNRLAQALEKQDQSHRLRSINLLPGGATHTFNPMAQHSAQSITENLVHVLRHRCPLPGMPLSDWTSFLVSSMSAVAFAMVHYSHQQKTVPDIALFLALCSLTKMEELDRREDFPPALRASIKFFLREASALVGGYDTVLNWLYQEEVLGALTGVFGHVFNAQRVGKHWLLPDVSIRDIAYGNLVTVVTVPAGAAVATQLILNQLSLEFYVRSNREHLSHAVRQLIVLDSVGSYGTEVVLSRLQRFAGAVGVATVLADQDYPALKKMGPEAVSVAGECQTKLLIPAPGDSNFMHVVAGLGLHSLPLPGLSFSVHDPDYVPQKSGQTLQGGQVQHEMFLERATEVLWGEAADQAKPVNLAWCQNTLARMLGYAHWHELEQQKRP